MARQDAYNIFQIDGVTKQKLAEIQAGIVESIQKNGNSFRFKSTNANLGVRAGSYEFDRFVNSVSQEYGTARGLGKGDPLKSNKVTVNVNVKRELTEEVNKFDADAYGLGSSLISVAESRANNHRATVRSDVESAFWAKALAGAIAGGTVQTGVVAGADIEETLESGILTLETTQNVFVRGVPRELIGGVARPQVYSKIKTKLNSSYNANFAVADEEINGLNGVAIFSELYLPKKVDYIFMAKESVAQPLFIDEYNVEKIPLSNDFGLQLFFNYGTEALAPDLIVVGIQTDATHTKVEVVTTLGTATDTIYVMKTQSTVYDPASPVSSTNYPAGAMFTYASAGGGAYTHYNA